MKSYSTTGKRDAQGGVAAALALPCPSASLDRLSRVHAAREAQLEGHDQQQDLERVARPVRDVAVEDVHVVLAREASQGRRRGGCGRPMRAPGAVSATAVSTKRAVLAFCFSSSCRSSATHAWKWRSVNGSCRATRSEHRRCTCL